MTPRLLSRWALAATIGLVALGGFTRGSGSGYGCADRWPLCHDGLLGGLLPRLEYHMVVEWSHRWLAAIVGILIVATAIQAWRNARRWVAWVAVAAVATVAVQAWVGRLVVTRNLDADLVSVHLAISMTVAALLTVVVVATTDSVVGRHPAWAARFGVGAALAFAVLILGSLVHNIYVPGWPLTMNALIPELGDRTIALHFSHRVVAAAATGLVLYLALAVRRDRRPDPERALAYTAALAFGANVGLGAAHVFTRVEWSGLVALHLGVASIAWVALVGAAASAAGASAQGARNN